MEEFAPKIKYLRKYFFFAINSERHQVFQLKIDNQYWPLLYNCGKMTLFNKSMVIRQCLQHDFHIRDAARSAPLPVALLFVDPTMQPTILPQPVNDQRHLVPDILMTFSSLDPILFSSQSLVNGYIVKLLAIKSATLKVSDLYF